MQYPHQDPHQQPDHLITSQPGVQLAAYTWGQRPSVDQPREIVLLLHGFPDRALFWDKVASLLAPHCHVIAYDMRGCGASSPIQGTRHYHYAPLIDDLYAVIDALSPDQKVHLVGHDWGALYGWDALFDPRAHGRIASFTTMAPSLNQVGLWMRDRLRRPTPKRLAQLLHQALISNGLMSFFTLPILPELMWRSGLALKMFGIFMRRFEGLQIVPPAGTTDDAIRYLGIYRANLLQQALRPRQPVQTTIPVHALIASRDPFLPPRVFEGCAAWVQHFTSSQVDAAHWAPLSQPASLAQTITRMTQAHPALTG